MKKVKPSANEICFACRFKNDHLVLRFAYVPIRSICIDVTNRCNLNCIHCFADSGNSKYREISLKEFDHALDLFCNKNINTIFISGGEPLLREDYLDIVEHSKDRIRDVTLLTNATLIDDKVAKHLSENEVNVQIGIDGSNSRTYERIRGASNFKKVIKGLENLLAHDMSGRMRLNMTIMKENAKNIEDMVEFAQILGVPMLSFSFVQKQGRAEQNWRNLKLSLIDKINISKFVSSKAVELEDILKIRISGINFDRQLFHAAGIDPPDMGCRVCEELFITSEGNFEVCNYFKNLERCLNGKRKMNISKLVECPNTICSSKINSLDRCIICSHRIICGGGCALKIREVEKVEEQ